MNCFKLYPSLYYTHKRSFTYSIFFFFIFTITFSSQSLSAQNFKENKVKFLLGFDNRRSFIEDKVTRVNGLRLGLQLKNPKRRIGIGIYNMANDILRSNEKVKEFDTPLDTLRIDYGFLSFYYEQVWLHEKKYEISTPFQIGAGNVERKYIDDNGEIQILTETNITILEMSIASHYKLKPWFGVGAGFGYNLVLSGEPEVSRAFNSPFYVLKLKLFLGDLYRGIRNGLKKESK